MQIGVIGSCGIVGSALTFGFKKLGHKVYEYDIKLNRSHLNFSSVINNSEIIYICVPTPSNEDGSCDTSIIKLILLDLEKYKYKGYIVIKSTVPPGFTEKQINLFYNEKICFVPEFLRERCATTDFVENQKLLAIGTEKPEVFEIVKKCHGNYPKHVVQLTPTQAELLKYYHNTINAARVVIANEFYDLCSKLNENYTEVKNALLFSTDLPDQYLDVNENMRGYSSICFNKDLPALYKTADALNVKLPLLKTIKSSNDRYKKTPFGNTRE